MRVVEIELPDEAATAALGARLSSLLRAQDFVCLSGPLGAGKTTLAQGLIKALTGADESPSPTFALVAPYESGAFTLRHFDLYRLENVEDVWDLGFEEALTDGVCLIEWPERIQSLIPDSALIIRLDHAGSCRRARMGGGGDWPERLERAALAVRPESPKTAKQ